MIRKPIESERRGEMKRYDLEDTSYCGRGEMEMVEVEDGKWVKYAEAINTLDEVMEYAECESEE